MIKSLGKESMMNPTIIRNDQEHQAALARLSELMATDPAPGTPEGDELEHWGLLIEAYEVRFAAPPPSARDMIECIMEERGLEIADLVRYFGSENAARAFLDGRAELTLDQMRALHTGLGIPADVLLQDPERESA
jgi:HTH-type transcriptional regulator/antitoxin HigA